MLLSPNLVVFNNKDELLLKSAQFNEQAEKIISDLDLTEEQREAMKSKVDEMNGKLKTYCETKQNQEKVKQSRIEAELASQLRTSSLLSENIQLGRLKTDLLKVEVYRLKENTRRKELHLQSLSRDLRQKTKLLKADLLKTGTARNEKLMKIGEKCDELQAILDNSEEARYLKQKIDERDATLSSISKLESDYLSTEKTIKNLKANLKQNQKISFVNFVVKLAKIAVTSNTLFTKYQVAEGNVHRLQEEVKKRTENKSLEETMMYDITFIQLHNASSQPEKSCAVSETNQPSEVLSVATVTSQLTSSDSSHIVHPINEVATTPIVEKEEQVNTEVGKDKTETATMDKDTEDVPMEEDPSEHADNVVSKNLSKERDRDEPMSEDAVKDTSDIVLNLANSSDPGIELVNELETSLHKLDGNETSGPDFNFSLFNNEEEENEGGDAGNFNFNFGSDNQFQFGDNNDEDKDPFDFGQTAGDANKDTSFNFNFDAGSSNDDGPDSFNFKF